jgi:hypothetical protein
MGDTDYDVRMFYWRYIMFKSLSRRTILATTFAFTILSSTVFAYADGLTGNYTAKGRNPDGSAYKGTAQITETDGSVAISWQVGASTYTGVGKVAGRVLEVNWNADAPVIYVINADGTLYGTWARGTALELLTPK